MSVLKSLNVLTSALLVLSVSTLTQAATRTFAVEFSDGSTNDAVSVPGIVLSSAC